MLRLIIERVQKSNYIDKVLVATTVNKNDDKIINT